MRAHALRIAPEEAKTADAAGKVGVGTTDAAHFGSYLDRHKNADCQHQSGVHHHRE